MASPRVLVAGRSGQVAQALAHVATKKGVELISFGRPELDLRSPALLEKSLSDAAPDVVINAAAYTDVDGAETEREEACALNRDGVANLYGACTSVGARLIHLSTDCVFDGTKAQPYGPADETGPLNAYGESKLAGERLLQDQPALVVRVSWVFSRFGSNFVSTMLKLARTRDEVRVVNDQLGCPTHAEDLADGLLEIAAAIAAPNFDNWGTYHLAGRGETDRASQAKAIFAASQTLGGPIAHVEGLPTSEYPTPARRPLNARLDCARTEHVFGVSLPQWENRLKDAVAELLNQGNSP